MNQPHIWVRPKTWATEHEMGLFVTDGKTQVYILKLSQYKSCSVSLTGCEVAVCEAQCVVGSVIRPVDPSLPPSLPPIYTLWSHSWPVWPTTPTSPLPLSGWDDRGRELGELTEKEGSLPDVACLSVCLSGWLTGWLAGTCCTYSKWIETH